MAAKSASKRKFTQAWVKNLQPNAGDSLYWDAELPGFGLRVTPHGSKSYLVQGRVHGKSKRFTLGSAALLPCDEARTRARRRLLEMRDGTDPHAVKRKEAAQSVTLRNALEEYVENKTTKNGRLRDSTKKDIHFCIAKHLANWLDQPVVNITRDRCVKQFRELSESSPTQANLTFRYLRAILNRVRDLNCTDAGDYTILVVNPVTQMQKIINWNPERPRQGRIKKEKIGAAWYLLQQCRDLGLNEKSTATCADLLAFMLLTGTRISEASKLTWDRVDLSSDVPTFHLPITKNHNPVTLPISQLLVEILQSRYTNRPPGSKFVFPSVRGKTPYMANTSSLFKRLSDVVGTKLSNHDLRRTFEDICQYCGVDSDKRRQLLNHLANDVHGQSYANNPDPSELLLAVEAVGEWIRQQADEFQLLRSGENVVHLSAAS